MSECDINENCSECGGQTFMVGGVEYGHGVGCPDATKPEPRGAMIVDLEGALKRSLLAPKPEPPPDVASEPDFEAAEIVCKNQIENHEKGDWKYDPSISVYKMEDATNVARAHLALAKEWKAKNRELHEAIAENAALKAEVERLTEEAVNVEHAEGRASKFNAERDEARAEAEEIRSEAKIRLEQAEAEAQKLREERDAAVAKLIEQRDALASAMIRCSIATGHGDTTDDLIAELERNLLRIQSDFGRLRGQRDDMARIIERRREEKGGE